MKPLKTQSATRQFHRRNATADRPMSQRRDFRAPPGSPHWARRTRRTQQRSGAPAPDPYPDAPPSSSGLLEPSTPPSIAPQARCSCRKASIAASSSGIAISTLSAPQRDVARCTLTRMRQFSLAVLVGMLLGGTLLGCAMSPAEQEATRRAWAERDAERERECHQARGRWIVGGCVFGGR